MDEYEELAHWERLRIHQIALIASLELTMTNPHRKEDFTNQYGEEEGEVRYREWHRSVVKRRNTEVAALGEIKVTIDKLRRAREEVELLTVVYHELTADPRFETLQQRIWRLLATKHKIYLKKGVRDE